MEAESREAVFAELRKQGIKAIKVVAADGSKANGEIRGVRKRMVALTAVGAALVAGAVAFVIFQRTADESKGPAHEARMLPRQAINGDRARIEQSKEQAFELRAEKFLARFVEPGRPFSASEAEWPSKAEVEAALNHAITYSESELTEQIDVKRMVVGLKGELRGYLRGGGLVSGYFRDLVKRQQTEIEIRDKHDHKVKELLSDMRIASPQMNVKNKALGTAYEYWMKANAQLQSMGIYPLPLPDQLRNFQFMMGIGG